VTAVIAEILGDPHWTPERVLSNSEADLALRALAKLPLPQAGWLAVLEADELSAILSRVESRATLVAAARFLGGADIETRELVGAWQQTSLAVLGLAVLEREEDDDALPDGWALPRAVDARQLRRLVAQLLTSEQGLVRLALLVRSGFAASPSGRRELMRALTATGAQPRHVFEDILARAELPPALLLEFMRDARWLDLPGPYTEALRLALVRRRWPVLRVLRPLLRGDGQSA
jgi:hypothetical protein